MRLNKDIFMPVTLFLMLTLSYQNCGEMKGINPGLLDSSSNDAGNNPGGGDPGGGDPGGGDPGGGGNPGGGENSLGFAELSWDANTESDLKEYRIYYGTSASDLKFKVLNLGLTGTPNAPSAKVDGLQKGVAYYFAVTALNMAGEESALSNIESKTP